MAIMILGQPLLYNDYNETNRNDIIQWVRRKIMSFRFFGDLFDLNGDGKLDWMEQAMDEQVFYMMMEEQKKE